MHDKNHTRSGIISLIIPVLYVSILLLSGVIGLSFEDGEAANLVFIGLTSFMLVLLPALLLVCGIVGNVHGGLALRDREPKGRCILVLVLSSLYTLASIAMAVALWIGLTQT